MSKGRKSILNAVTALIQMAVTGIIGLILNKSIMLHFGSDYNGINSTIAQLISVLMVFEGGFTLASNVALFEPISCGDRQKINGILAATRIRFKTVSFIVLGVGLALTALYPFAISTKMPRPMIAGLMLVSLVPTFINFGFNMKHRVLILSHQNEYIISLITTGTYIVGNLFGIGLIRFGRSIIEARAIISLFTLLSYVLIALYCKKHYPFADYHEKPLFEEIKGTKSVIFLKLTGVIYNAVPIVAISMIPEKGTLLASVYAVYKGIIAMVRNSLTSITNAPRLSFGAVFAEGRLDDAKKLFNQYEIITAMGISVVVGTTSLLIIPFVELYTAGVKDVEYKNVALAAIMIITAIVEILHIPSGQMIQMSGRFTVARKIQSSALILLVVSMVLGCIFFGIYGVVSSILLAACLLAALEISYTSVKIFKRGILEIARNMLPCILINAAAMAIGFGGHIQFSNYVSFIIYGIAAVAGLALITGASYWLIDKEAVCNMTRTVVRSVIKRS